MRPASLLPLLSLLLAFLAATTVARETTSFNGDWRLHIGDQPAAADFSYDDSAWQPVTLPRAWNEDEAFALPCAQLSDTVVWYRKRFTYTPAEPGERVYIEFEGVRQGCDVYLNGQLIGGHEDGVMAFGLDLSPHLREGTNVIAVRVDSDWDYESRAHTDDTGTGGTKFQWNNRNFNANYGGIPHNVWLHRCPPVHQTLPLFSNLATTGTYIYGTDYDIARQAVTVHAETQVVNTDAAPRRVRLEVILTDADGRCTATFAADEAPLLAPGDTLILSAGQRLEGIHFWSWGYGYLYTVSTRLLDTDGRLIDEVNTPTGFRSTRFAEGKIWLNDRVLMVHGFAQRTSNEWPGIGIDVPAWLSDYSNALMVEGGANVVRWMHVTPSAQDAASCDRVGLIQAMPAGDAEKDVEGPQWIQRTELMRDAIIYMRNHPSILFYESGNESISPEHMAEMVALRNRYDPHGGRAIGSREMLDVPAAEYGGEMLYVNKSATRPLWAMEYCRDEGLRRYWDAWSYPFHTEGDGPLYRNAPAQAYNHNQDQLALEHVARWNEFWQFRPGMGRRVNSGGVKIIFSDTNTHARGEVGYRTSGVVDAMRLPKDAFYAHQVMWDGWVEPETVRTHIIGHWNYPAGTVKPVYVISSADSVELRLNGRSLGYGKRSEHFLFTFDSVRYEPGTLVALPVVTPPSEGTDEQQRASDKGDARIALAPHDTLTTIGAPARLSLTALTGPDGLQADGADVALVSVEVVDSQGRRCPLDNRLIRFALEGPAEWRGGIAAPMERDSMETFQGGENPFGNYVLSRELPVECGINRVLVRTTTTPGTITLTAHADGLPSATLTLCANSPVATRTLPLHLDRGPTPSTPSYADHKQSLCVETVEAGSNSAEASHSLDDNELTEWRSDGNREGAWIAYTLADTARVDEISLKLTGWRNRCYPLAVEADGREVWRGLTPATLGYANIRLPQGVEAKRITLRMLGPSISSSRFGEVKELAGGQAAELDRYIPAEGRVELRIVETDFLQLCHEETALEKRQ